MRENIDHLFTRNKVWAKKMTDIDPEFFSQLAKLQSPKYLWIGCADSRVSANQVIDLAPGEVFVHRNIANIVVHTDLNCLSVIQYAVEVLNVHHIIICGHYGCGGIQAAFEGMEFGLIDNWLRHIKDVYRWHQTEIDAQPDDKSKLNLLCEKNVIEQVANVCHTSIVQRAWKNKKDLTVHGVIYDIENGILHNLDTEVSESKQLNSTHLLNEAN